MADIRGSQYRCNYHLIPATLSLKPVSRRLEPTRPTPALLNHYSHDLLISVRRTHCAQRRQVHATAGLVHKQRVRPGQIRPTPDNHQSRVGITSTDPCRTLADKSRDETEITQVHAAGAKDVDAAVQAARNAFNGPWGGLTSTQRGRLLSHLADRVEANAKTLATVEAWDSGECK